MSLFRFSDCKDLEEVKKMLDDFVLANRLDQPVTADDPLGSWAPVPPGVSVEAGVLVNAWGESLSRADRRNTDKAANGVVLRVEGGRALHSTISLIKDARVSGTLNLSTNPARTVFLGNDGGLSFEEPVGGAGTILSQAVGRALRSKGGSRYEVSISIGAPSLV